MSVYKQEKIDLQDKYRDQSLIEGSETIDNYCMETSNNSKQLGTFYLDMETLHFVTRFDLSISIWHDIKDYGMLTWFKNSKDVFTRKQYDQNHSIIIYNQYMSLLITCICKKLQSNTM